MCGPAFRKFFKLLIVAFTWLQFTFVVANAKECPGPDARAVVYDIVDEKNKDKRLGTAFLVDWKRALFLTAQHNLGSPSLRLKKKNVESYAFRIIASGNETFSYNLTEDWALIQAIGADPHRGMWPLPDTELIYDMPSSISFKEAVIIGSETAIQTIQSINWIDNFEMSGICKNEQVALLQVASYDKGYSGAPLYSRDQCGVVGLTSRFAAPEDAPTENRAELIKYFRKFSKKDSPTYQVMREIVKSHHYVKIVPARCLIDRMIDQSWRDIKGQSNISKLFREETRPETSYTIEELDKIDENNKNSKLVLLIDKINSHEDWRWVDLLQLVDRYYRGLKMGDWDDSIDHFYALQAAVIKLSSKKNYGNVAGSFERAYKRYKVQYVQHQQETGGSLSSLDTELQSTSLDKVGQQFVRENLSWKHNSATNLALPENSNDGTANEWLAAGRRLAELYADSENLDVSPSTRTLLKDTAVGLLATGVGKTNKSQAPDSWGSGVSQIANLLASDVSSNFVSLAIATQLNVELAKVAKATITDTNSDDWIIAHNIEQQSLPINDPAEWMTGPLGVAPWVGGPTGMPAWVVTPPRDPLGAMSPRYDGSSWATMPRDLPRGLEPLGPTQPGRIDYRLGPANPDLIDRATNKFNG